MKTCKKCGELNGDNRDACFKCGHAFPEMEQSETIKNYEHTCVHCGAKIDANDTFYLCQKCSAKKSWFSALLVTVSIIACLITLVVINIILGFLFEFEIKLGWLPEYLLLLFFVRSAFFFSKKVFKKSKHENEYNTYAILEAVFAFIGILFLILLFFSYVLQAPVFLLTIFLILFLIGALGVITCAIVICKQNTTTEKHDASSKLHPIKKIKQYKENHKRRYCKFCGGLIDGETKKCTSCGKQYFHFKIKTRFNKLTCIILISLITISCSLGVNIYQHNEIAKLKSQVAANQEEMDQQDKQIDDLHEQIKSKDKAIENLKYFYENTQ